MSIKKRELGSPPSGEVEWHVDRICYHEPAPEVGTLFARATGCCECVKLDGPIHCKAVGHTAFQAHQQSELKGLAFSQVLVRQVGV